MEEADFSDWSGPRQATFFLSNFQATLISRSEVYPENCIKILSYWHSAPRLLQNNNRPHVSHLEGHDCAKMLLGVVPQATRARSLVGVADYFGRLKESCHSELERSGGIGKREWAKHQWASWHGIQLLDHSFFSSLEETLRTGIKYGISTRSSETLSTPATNDSQDPAKLAQFSGPGLQRLNDTAPEHADESAVSQMGKAVLSDFIELQNCQSATKSSMALSLRRPPSAPPVMCKFKYDSSTHMSSTAEKSSNFPILSGLQKPLQSIQSSSKSATAVPAFSTKQLATIGEINSAPSNLALKRQVNIGKVSGDQESSYAEPLCATEVVPAQALVESLEHPFSSPPVSPSNPAHNAHSRDAKLPQPEFQIERPLTLSYDHPKLSISPDIEDASGRSAGFIASARVPGTAATPGISSPPALKSCMNSQQIVQPHTDVLSTSFTVPARTDCLSSKITTNLGSPSIVKCPTAITSMEVSTSGLLTTPTQGHCDKVFAIPSTNISNKVNLSGHKQTEWVADLSNEMIGAIGSTNAEGKFVEARLLDTADDLQDISPLQSGADDPNLAYQKIDFKNTMSLYKLSKSETTRQRRVRRTKRKQLQNAWVKEGLEKQKRPIFESDNEDFDPAYFGEEPPSPAATTKRKRPAQSSPITDKQNKRSKAPLSFLTSTPTKAKDEVVIVSKSPEMKSPVGSGVEMFVTTTRISKRSNQMQVLPSTPTELATSRPEHIQNVAVPPMLLLKHQALIEGLATGHPATQDAFLDLVDNIASIRGQKVSQNLQISQNHRQMTTPDISTKMKGSTVSTDVHLVGESSQISEQDSEVQPKSDAPQKDFQQPHTLSSQTHTPNSQSNASRYSLRPPPYSYAGMEPKLHQSQFQQVPISNELQNKRNPAYLDSQKSHHDAKVSSQATGDQQVYLGHNYHQQSGGQEKTFHDSQTQDHVLRSNPTHSVIFKEQYHPSQKAGTVSPSSKADFAENAPNTTSNRRELRQVLSVGPTNVPRIPMKISGHSKPSFPPPTRYSIAQQQQMFLQTQATLALGRQLRKTSVNSIRIPPASQLQVVNPSFRPMSAIQSADSHHESSNHTHPMVSNFSHSQQLCENIGKDPSQKSDCPELEAGASDRDFNDELEEEDIDFVQMISTDHAS